MKTNTNWWWKNGGSCENNAFAMLSPTPHMGTSCSAEPTVQSNDVMERPLKARLVFFAVFPLLGGIAAAIP